MVIEKNTRHTKIIGELGEHIICNWLSRSGFEVAIVDHTGIDIIAYNPSTKQRLGISVKSRTRTVGKEGVPLGFFKEVERERKLVFDACNAFHCEPWIGIYIETIEGGDLFLFSYYHYKRKYKTEKEKVSNSWKMSKDYQERYKKDKDVKHIRYDFQLNNWEW